MAINQYEYNYITGRFYSSNVGTKYQPFGTTVSSNALWGVSFESVKMSGTGILAENVDSSSDGWSVGVDSNGHPYVYWSRSSSTYRGTYTFSGLTVSWNTWFSISFDIASNSANPVIRCTLNGTSAAVVAQGRWNVNYTHSLYVGGTTTTIRGTATVSGYAYNTNTRSTATFDLDSLTTGATSTSADGYSFTMPAVQHYSDPAPVASATFTYTSATVISLKINANASCNKWEYKVGSGSWTTGSTSVGTSVTLSVTVSSTATVYVRVTKVSNGYTGESSVVVNRSAPLVNVSLTSRTSSSLYITASTNTTCNLWEYSTNGGSTYTQFSTASGTSVTYNITGLSNNTTYSVVVRARATNYIKGTSSTYSFATTDGSTPSVTISLASGTATSLKVSAVTDVLCNLWEYSIDDGSTFTTYSTVDATATTCEITGLTPNTTYYVKIRARKSSNNVKGTSARGSYKTIGQGTLNSVTSFYADAATVQIPINGTFYSTAFDYTLEIRQDGITIVTANVPVNAIGTQNITITLTSAQRTTLLNAMSDVASFSATFVLKTYDNGTQIGDSSIAVATIQTSASSSAPNAPTFNYADTNASTVAITGDSSKLIQGQSTLGLTNLTATAKNGATIASYTITVGGTTVSSTSGGTVNVGTISQSGTVTLIVVAKDSRGNTSATSVDITCYAYAPPTITECSVARNASDDSQIDMSVSGVFSNIGSNTAVIKYKYKKTSASTYGSEFTVTPTISSGTFTYSEDDIATFENDFTYNVVVTVSDGILSADYNLVVPTVTPLIAYRPKGIGIGGIPQGNYNLEVAQNWHVTMGGIVIPDSNYADMILGSNANGDGLEWKYTMVGGYFNASYDPSTSILTISADFGEALAMSYDDPTSILTIEIA